MTNHKKVAILATDGIIMTRIYHREIEAAGMQAWQPDAETQKKVMSLIYDEIKRGEKGNRHSFAAIDRAVRGAGCDCAILSCTELSVYREYHGLYSLLIRWRFWQRSAFASLTVNHCMYRRFRWRNTY